MAAKSRSAKFYASHPASRERKQNYDRKFNAKPAQVNRREDLNRYNDRHNAPKGDGMDAIHKGNKIVGYRKASKNRGDKNDSSGDRRSRGGKVRFGKKS